MLPVPPGARLDKALQRGHYRGQPPVNIGSDEMVTINQLVDIASKAAKKVIHKKHIEGPLGVRGRNSENTFIKQEIGWSPNYPLEQGIKHTYNWIHSQLENSH